MTFYLKRWMIQVFLLYPTHDYRSLIDRPWFQLVWHWADDRSYLIGGIVIGGRMLGFDWGVPF